MVNFIAALPFFGVIEISGDDASKFLQGQLTSDISDLQNRQTCFSAWCNAQGRVICTLLLIHDHGRYLILLPATMVVTVSQRLKMFVLRAKVIITIRSGDYACFGSAGFDTSLITDELHLAGSGCEPVLTTVLDATAIARAALLVPFCHVDAFYSRLTTVGWHLSAEQLWQLQDIRDGLPWVYPQTSTEFMPAELNLERVGGLSYNKGCYPGQEIIARVHYRGRLKRRLCQGHMISPDITVNIGTQLYAGEVPRAVGIIVNCIRESIEIVRILAVLDCELTDTSPVVIDSGEALHLAPFPNLSNIP